MSGPTPGPWVAIVSKAGRYLTSPYVCGGEVGNEDRVAELCGYPQVSQPTIDANARLIAAAPDLLAACRLAFEALPHAADCAKDPCRCRVSVLATAIAKAEGR